MAFQRTKLVCLHAVLSLTPHSIHVYVLYDVVHQFLKEALR